MNFLYGRKIQIATPYPRVQCSPTFSRLQAPELVQSTNQWMAEFFGYTTAVPDGQVYELNQEIFVMTQTTWDAIRESSSKYPAQPRNSNETNDHDFLSDRGI